MVSETRVIGTFRLTKKIYTNDLANLSSDISQQLTSEFCAGVSVVMIISAKQTRSIRVYLTLKNNLHRFVTYSEIIVAGHLPIYKCPLLRFISKSYIFSKILLSYGYSRTFLAILRGMVFVKWHANYK